MSELQRYAKALAGGDIDLCCSIERLHDLDGYPPTIVAIGLKAYDDGKDVGAVIDSVLVGGSEDPDG
jgi:hypothetical protein